MQSPVINVRVHEQFVTLLDETAYQLRTDRSHLIRSMLMYAATHMPGMRALDWPDISPGMEGRPRGSNAPGGAGSPQA